MFVCMSGCVHVPYVPMLSYTTPPTSDQKCLPIRLDQICLCARLVKATRWCGGSAFSFRKLGFLPRSSSFYSIIDFPRSFLMSTKDHRPLWEKNSTALHSINSSSRVNIRSTLSLIFCVSLFFISSSLRYLMQWRVKQRANKAAWSGPTASDGFRELDNFFFIHSFELKN